MIKLRFIKNFSHKKLRTPRYNKGRQEEDRLSRPFHR